MRCRQARRKLSKLAGGPAAGADEALREHLKQCSSCARLAQAEELLRGDLEQARHYEPSHPMTIEKVREVIAIRDRKRTEMNLGARIMRQAADTIHNRPRLSMAMAASLALLIASALVPVSTEQAIAYEVAFVAPASGLVLPDANAELMLEAMDIDGARFEIHESSTGAEYRIGELTDMDQVRRVVAVLDSLGGPGARRVVATSRPGVRRTVWQLILDSDDDSGAAKAVDRERVRVATDGGEELPEEDFVLWLPTEDSQSDSATGILLNRQGDRTTGWILGGALVPDQRGWNPLLNGNTVLKHVTPEGDTVEFDFTKVEDVRELERMGYNFWLMKFDTPGQMPIKGLGPKLNKVEPNPFDNAAVISFMIPQAHQVQVDVLDAQNRVIRSLLDAIELAGIHSVVWDGLDNAGKQTPPGTYVCRFVAGDYRETVKIVLKRWLPE